MKECKKLIAYQTRCNSKSNLAPIIFYDPIDMSTELMFPCQIHRDEIIRPIMKPYHDLENLIKIAEDARRSATQRARTYEITFDPDVKSELGNLYQARRKLTKYSCWLPDCEYPKHILYDKMWRNGSHTKIEVSELSRPVFTALSFGQDGKMATELRLHENCFNKLKRKFGKLEFDNTSKTVELTEFN